MISHHTSSTYYNIPQKATLPPLTVHVTADNVVAISLFLCVGLLVAACILIVCPREMLPAELFFLMGGASLVGFLAALVSSNPLTHQLALRMLVSTLVFTTIGVLKLRCRHRNIGRSASFSDQVELDDWDDRVHLVQKRGNMSEPTGLASIEANASV